MTEPLRYPDPPDVRLRRAAPFLNARDEADSVPLRDAIAAQMAARGPEEAQDGAAEAVRVFGRLPGGRDGKGPRW